MMPLIEKVVAEATNHLLTRLRNQVNLKLTREEFRYSRLSFSQFGEDLAVVRGLEETFPEAPKIYVDAGCFHPIHFSNTLLLHKRGWRGFNVDLTFEKIMRFRAHRPDDYSVVAALSSEEREVVVHASGGLTDCILIHDCAAASATGEALLGGRRVRTTTLDQVIESSGWKIDGVGYLNVDCEGHDLEVLQGFNLASYRPPIITIEAFPPAVHTTIQYLSCAGYKHMETLNSTMLFVRVGP